MGHAHHPAGSAALDAVINKSQPFLCFIPVTALRALQAKEGWQRVGIFPPHGVWRQCQRPQMHAASIQTQSPRGEGKVQLAVLIYFGGGFLLGARDTQYFE